METITNYPKLARLRIIFFIEVIYIILETIGILTAVAAFIILYKKLTTTLDAEHATKIDDGIIIAAFSILAVCYLAELAIVIVLYQGVKQKNYKKIGIWALANIGILLFLIVSAIMELVEEKYIGVTSLLFNIIVIIYRCVAIKIAFDAVQELRRFPLAVPFVQMRDCEERV